MRRGPRHRRQWLDRLCRHPLLSSAELAEDPHLRARAEALLIGGERRWLGRLFRPAAAKLAWTEQARARLWELDRRDADALFVLTEAPTRAALDAALTALGRTRPCYLLTPQESGSTGDFICTTSDTLEAKLLETHLLMLLEQRLPIALRLGHSDDAHRALSVLLLAFLQRQRLAAIGEADNRALTLLPVRLSDGRLELATALDLDAFITLHSDLGGTTSEWIARLAALIEQELRVNSQAVQG